MVSQMKWFERSFNVKIPAGVFPCIIERLRGAPARLEELTRTLSPADLTRKPGGAWSIQEHAGHLLDLSELDESRLADYAAGRPILTIADLRNRKTAEAKHNERSVKAILGEFRAARQEFVRKLEGLAEEEVVRTSEHPRLRVKMSLAEWCHFVAEHDDHHLARISSISSA